MSRLLKLLLFSLMKPIQSREGSACSAAVLLSGDTPRFADALCSLFKVCDAFKVHSKESEVEELTSVRSHADVTM